MAGFSIEYDLFSTYAAPLQRNSRYFVSRIMVLPNSCFSEPQAISYVMPLKELLFEAFWFIFAVVEIVRFLRAAMHFWFLGYNQNNGIALNVRFPDGVAPHVT
jgi:hypothetical protein